MVDDMIDYLPNQIQCEDNGVSIDLCPQFYNSNNNDAQSITLLYVTSIPVEYYGMLS